MVAPRRVPKATGSSCTRAVAFRGWVFQNIFNIFDSQTVLGNVLHVSVTIVVVIPNDLQEPH
jgi:hypothetical protein